MDTGQACRCTVRNVIQCKSVFIPRLLKGHHRVVWWPEMALSRLLCSDLLTKITKLPKTGELSARWPPNLHSGHWTGLQMHRQKCHPLQICLYSLFTLNKGQHRVGWWPEMALSRLLCSDLLTELTKLPKTGELSARWPPVRHRGHWTDLQSHRQKCHPPPESLFSCIWTSGCPRTVQGQDQVHCHFQMCESPFASLLPKGLMVT